MRTLLNNYPLSLPEKAEKSEKDGLAWRDDILGASKVPWSCSRKEEKQDLSSSLTALYDINHII